MGVNSSNIKQVISNLIDEKGNPKLPEGWTYLIHGTNTSQWNKEILEGDSFVVKGIEAGLYCVEKENAIENQKTGSDVSKIHSQLKQQQGEKDFEIRCLIYKDLRRQKDREEFAGRLTQEEIDDVNRYHTKKPYYPSVPNGTKLIKLTTTEFDEITNSEKEILWYIPEKYLNHYLKECGVKTKEKADNISVKKIGNLEVVTEKNDNCINEVRKLNGVAMQYLMEFANGSYEKKSTMRIANKGINVSDHYMNYTNYKQQYNANSNTYCDILQGPIIDNNNNVIGETKYIETDNIKTGTKESKEYKLVEGENGIFQIRTIQRKQGDNYQEISTIDLQNRVSGNREKIQYAKENDKETYTYMENGLLGKKITKTARGTTIDIYKDGQPYGTFEYDENGKALVQMASLAQLPDDYVRSQFDIVIPEHEVVSHILPDELYADIKEEQDQEQAIKENKTQENRNNNENEIVKSVSTQKLGKETLEQLKNVNQMDRVQFEIGKQYRTKDIKKDNGPDR